MSKKYQEYISGITIEYDKQLHKCPDNNCYYIKKKEINEIEYIIEDIKRYLDDESEVDCDEDIIKTIECECGNEIEFTYNPYEIIKKYI